MSCLAMTPIPPGAQEVHVVITESEVRLDPATFRAGDVYLVLDGPVPGVDFVNGNAPLPRLLVP